MDLQKEHIRFWYLLCQLSAKASLCLGLLIDQMKFKILANLPPRNAEDHN